MSLPYSITECHKLILKQQARIRELEAGNYHDWGIDDPYMCDEPIDYPYYEREEETPMNSIELAFEAHEAKLREEAIQGAQRMWYGYELPIRRFWAGHTEDEMDFEEPLNSIERLLLKDFI